VHGGARISTATLLALIAALAGLAIAAERSAARPTISTYDPGAPVSHRSPSGAPLMSTASKASGAPPTSTASKPSAPPASAANAPGSTATDRMAEVDRSMIASASAGDPLVDNGLGSPQCGSGNGAGELSVQAARSCRGSGFDAASAPTGNYGFDVNIETGPLGVGAAALGLGGAALGVNNGALETLLQQLILAPVWNSLVWIAHALIAMLEWCYTIDLIDSPAMGGLARGLREAQTTFTQPWLAIVLAVASVLTLHHGLIRRRVAETLGQALLTIAMMAGGLWVIANPVGTVGALGQWANAAGLGTLATVSTGRPDRAGRALSDAMRGVFDAAIGRPWCYMEFGNVNWCSEPLWLDRRLHASALATANLEQVLIGCPMTTGPTAICAKRGSPQARALSESVALLRQARTNGDVFLALPPDGVMRNSVSLSGSPLNVLCRGAAKDTECSGPTAAEAEFRSGSGTWARVEGLVLIAVGAVGMMLLLGFLALHLLAASLISLIYLLLTPAAVLAPALGDGGRAIFRKWATRLLGAVTSKLIFSFLLGTILMVARIVTDLQGLGWWIRWLLLAGLWWGAFQQRHNVLGFTHGQQHGAANERRSLARRFKQAYETPMSLARAAGRLKARRQRPAPDVERRRERAQAGHERASQRADAQVGRVLESESGEARAQAAAVPRLQTQIASSQSRLGRIEGERRKALQSGDTRRAARLALRAQRVEGDIARDRQTLTTARRAAADGERARRHGGQTHTREQREERARFLDAQAALPDGLGRGGGSAEGALAPGGAQAGSAVQAMSSGAAPRARRAQGRDYAALAGLLGYGRAEYERLDPASRRRARLDIDRELALRHELNGAAADVAAGGTGQLGRREQREVDRDFEKALAQRLGDRGHGLPHGLPPSHPKGATPHDPWQIEARRRARESPVMRDARDVAERRKRQLGWPARR
jgi:hypothetical protein